MKLTSLAFFLPIAVSHAAVSYTVNTAAFVNDESGARLPENSAVVSIGTYSATPTFDSFSTSDDITDTYLELGFGLLDSSLDLPGYFSMTITSGESVDESTFNGDDIFLLIGNSTSLSSSSEFLVWQATSNPGSSTFSINPPSPPGPTAIELNDNTGNLLFGSFGPGDGGPEFFLASAATIPEPSSALLSGLALFALVGRRSRK